MARAPIVWAHRLALATAGATAVLIVAGGLVTNTGAALAVPDWPTTFGRNMFLYPWSEMVGGVFYEHSHRLLGALVGLLTVGLGTLLWVTERRGWVRALGVAAVVLVGLQGLVGGLRVLLVRDALAIVHGGLAQAFFALTAALAVVTSPRWTAPAEPAVPAARGLPWLAFGVTAAVYGQVVLGALATHAGWVLPHVAGAVVVAALGGVLAARVLGGGAARPEVAWPAGALAVLLGLQLALGTGAYLARFTGFAVPGGAAGALALPVTHRLAASLLLGAAVTLTLELWRLRRAEAAARRPRGAVGAGVVRGRVPA